MLALDLRVELRILVAFAMPDDAGLPYFAGLPELNTTCLECLLLVLAVDVVEVTKVAGVGAGGPAIGSSDGI